MACTFVRNDPQCFCDSVGAREGTLCGTGKQNGTRTWDMILMSLKKGLLAIAIFVHVLDGCSSGACDGLGGGSWCHLLQQEQQPRPLHTQGGTCKPVSGQEHHASRSVKCWEMCPLGSLISRTTAAAGPVFPSVNHSTQPRSELETSFWVEPW